MSHSASQTRSVLSPRSAGDRSEPRASLYQDITDAILAELEAGCVPWVQLWGAVPAGAAVELPCNAATGRQYSGINILILWGAIFRHGYGNQSWLTFRQALALGGHVRKGETGTTIVYADRFVPEKERRRADREGDAPGFVPFLKRFVVFNASQCEGLPETIAVTPPPLPAGLILPAAEALIRAVGIDIRIGGDKAFYSVMGDYVQVPRPDAYFEPVNWHRTALHELGHASGAAHRLNRDLSGAFGSKKYAQEELIAEMTSAFTCAALGIVPTVRHADYIGAWLDILREDNRAVIRAASAASKAADYLLAFHSGGNADGEGDDGHGPTA